MLALTAVREPAGAARLELPAGARGRWRCVLGGAEHELGGRVELEQVQFRDWPLALLERGGA